MANAVEDPAVEAARRAAQDAFAKTLDATNIRNQQIADQAQAKRKELTVKISRGETRPVTSTELARSSEVEAVAALKVLNVNNVDPHSNFGKKPVEQTPKQIIETKVKTEVVLEKLGNNTAGRPIEVTTTTTQPISQTTSATGGYIPPTTLSVTKQPFIIDPSYGNPSRGVNGSKPQRVEITTNVQGNDYLTYAAQAENALAGNNGTVVSGIENDAGLKAGGAGARTTDIKKEHLPAPVMGIEAIHLERQNNAQQN